MIDGNTATGGEAHAPSPDATTRAARTLLACGALSGPLYFAVGLTEAFTRPGFDIRRHDLSLLSNGSLGWIHILLFLVTGSLVILGALGMRRTLTTGRGRTWAPLLVAVFGLGLIGGGAFVADPALGFPPGTPASANSVSWHGVLHLVSAAIGFVSLIAACFVLARRFAAQHEPPWVAYSAIAGAGFLVAFAGIAAGGPGNSWTILGFWLGLALVWSWVLAVMVRLAREARA